jgi:transcriptional regulator with XRE-family HTH domain
METLPDVGKCFKALRKQSGKTQKEVAACVGMRQEALSRFESGRGSDFSLSKFLRLLQALSLNMEFTPATPSPTLASLLAERRSDNNKTSTP